MTTRSVDLTCDITEGFFESIRQLTDKNIVMQKRVTEITIELLQNIKKHGISTSRKSLTIEKHEAGYSIKTCNQLHANEVDKFKNKIIHINSLDYPQLKKEYLRILQKGHFSERSGAGLGLYRIAIRTRSLLHASFTRINQDFFNFNLHVNLAIPV